MKYNNEFNIIDTSNKAYLLGFLYGDGNITTYFENNKKRYQTRLSISIVDKDIIFLINKEFPFFHISDFNYSKYNKNQKKQISIINRSKKLYDDLLKWGLLPRKSYENKEYLSIPPIPNEFLSDFIRGYFDADGSVFKLKYRVNLINVEITSNSYNFINELNDILIKNNIFSWKIRTKKPMKKGENEYYVILIIKQHEIIKFKNFIYNNNSFYLKRKYDLLYNHQIINKVNDRKINCPICNSFKTIKNGKRKHKIRMKCNNCNKNFTIN